MRGKNIKYFTVAIVISLIFFYGAQEVSAGKVALTWTAPTTNSDSSPLTDLGGYKIYYGTTARTGSEPGSDQGGYSNVVDASNVSTYTINGIADTGTTYFSVVAYDTSDNKSVFSGEVHKTPGDMNNSGSVDLSDFNVLAINFGSVVDNCVQNGNYNQADVNLDCSVNLSDFNALAINFGYSLN